jgi:hypothetical protein
MAENCIMAEGHPLPARVGGSCDTASSFLSSFSPRFSLKKPWPTTCSKTAIALLRFLRFYKV